MHMITITQRFFFLFRLVFIAALPYRSISNCAFRSGLILMVLLLLFIYLSYAIHSSAHYRLIYKKIVYFQKARKKYIKIRQLESQTSLQFKLFIFICILQLLPIKYWKML